MAESDATLTSIDDFTTIRPLGMSRCNHKMTLVTYKHQEGMFCLKELPRKTYQAQVVQLKKFNSQFQTCPFVVNISHVFWSGDSIYLVREFIPGGTLCNQITTHGSFPE